MNEQPYSELAGSFSTYFADLISEFPSQPENLYDPVRYFFTRGGKRLRPLLTLAAADCFSTGVSYVNHAAGAIELFHNFSLIHDDIMDQAPLRRNMPTVHKKWSLAVAILSGDVLLVKAFQELSRCGEKSISLNRIFCKTAREVCEGQQLDMDFENRENVSVKEYMNMIRLKTAALFGCCLKSGAICANADFHDETEFYKAGENLGIAFQLTDDYLDVFGDSKMTGKQKGGDIILNKKTWLLIKALEDGDPQQKKSLDEWISKTDFDPKEKVNAVQGIFKSLDLHTSLEAQIANYLNKTEFHLKKCIETGRVDQGKTELLISFLKSLNKRNK